MKKKKDRKNKTRKKCVEKYDQKQNIEKQGSRS